MRLWAIGSAVFVAVAFSALVPSKFLTFRSINKAKERRNDYRVELTDMDRKISEAPVGDVQGVTRLAYLKYRRATLTGDDGDFRAAERAVDDAIGRFGPTADLCLLSAHLHLRFHRPDAARKSLEAVAGLSQASQGRALAGDVALQQGDYAAARAAYRDVSAAGRRWEGLARLAHLEWMLGNERSADRLYGEAQDEVTAKDMRSFAWVELRRGLLDLSCGRHEEAVAHYRRAGRAYPGHWLVDEHLAEALAASGKFDQAIALYLDAVERSPRPEGWHALGDLYACAGKAELARTWHDRAVAAYLESAGRGEVHYFHNLSAFYADVRGDGAEAVRWAGRDLELRKNHTTYDSMGWALYRAGRFDEAVPAMQRAMSFGVVEAHLFHRAGLVHLAAGRTTEGKALTDKAAAINPRHGSFHVHR